MCHPARAVRLQKAEPSIRRLVEAEEGETIQPAGVVQAGRKAFLISIDIDATVFSIWWWFIK